MPAYHRLAEQWNSALERDCPGVFSLLSSWGKAAYFPSDGILGQTAEAKGTELNATIGIALDGERLPMRLSAIEKSVALPPVSVFPYAPSHGLPELRAEWQRQIGEKNPSLSGLISLPVVTAGLTHALRIAGELLIDSGDTLIVPDPSWGNYRLIYPQASLTTFPAFDGDGFNLNGLKAMLKSSKGKRRTVLLNFPNNPAGYVPTTEEAAAMTDLFLAAAKESPLTVILDDAYFGLVYEDGVEQESFIARFGNLHERLLVVKVDGSSKEDFAWGLRVAYLTFACKGMTEAAAHALEEKVAGLVRGSVSSASKISQSLLLQSYGDPSHARDKQANEEILARRFRAAKTEAKDNQGLWTLLPCNAGYFLCVRLRSGLDAESIRKQLLGSGVGVIALPGSLLRIAYCSVAEERIPELFARIRKACA